MRPPFSVTPVTERRTQWDKPSITVQYWFFLKKKITLLLCMSFELERLDSSKIITFSEGLSS